jgi:dUTP pyrophosphatase
MKIAKLNDGAILPTRKHPEDAGLDLFSSESMTIAPRSCMIIHTGVTIELPDNFVAQVWPKSKSNYLIGAGIIDAGYQGEILVKIVNYSNEPLLIFEGEAIAQLVIVPVITPSVEEVSKDAIHSSKSARGTTGGIVSQVEKQSK